MRKVFLMLSLMVMVYTSAFAQTGFRASLSGTTCPGAGCLNIDVIGQGTSGFQITGTFTGTLQFEQTVDGTTFTTWPVTANGAAFTVTSTTGTGLWFGSVAGVRQVRVRFSAYTSGTAQITMVTASARLGGGGSGGPVAAENVNPGTFAEGDFAFQGKLAVGTDVSGGVQIEVCEANCFKVYGPEGTNWSWRISEGNFVTVGVANAFDAILPIRFQTDGFFINNNSGQSFSMRAGFDYTNMFQLGNQFGGSSGLQTLTTWVPQFGNEDTEGGDLRVTGGLSTGDAAPGELFLASAARVASGSDRQVYVDKVKISEHQMQWLATGASKPTCNADNRFLTWPIAGGTGVADSFEVCMKDASDVYGWKALATP